MNKHEATVLGIRLVAVLNVTNLLSTLPYLLSVREAAINLEQVGGRNPWITPLVIFDLLISIVLWFGASQIAQWMWRASEEETQGTSINAIQFQTILFSAVGLYLLVSVIPDALEFFVYFGQKVTADVQSASLSDYVDASGFLIQIFISAGLLFNSLQRGKRNPPKGKTA